MSRAFSLLQAGPAYLRLRRSQYWPDERLRGLVQTRLRETLAAAARIPFYRDRLGTRTRPEQLAELPILPRAQVGESWNAACGRSTHPRRLC